jgi:hypothetical protein
MNFGYLIVVSKNDDVDYLRCAYAAALSIKNTQKPGYDKVALVIDEPESVKQLTSPWVFDHVIEWDQETFWDGRSWMDKLSPFDNTVCIDADMLFLRDYSHWIDYFIEHKELYVASKAYTYRGEQITSDFYRKAFTKNKIPSLYSMFTFFKKNSDIADEFFELGRYILKNPTEFKNLYMSDSRPKIVGTDEAFGLAAKILDIADDIAHDLDFPKLVHLKPMVQNWPWAAEKVTDHAGFYFNIHGNLKIGNYQQYDIVHYVEKDLITDEIVSMLEEIAWNKN